MISVKSCAHIEYSSSILDELVESLERLADEHHVKLTMTTSHRLYTPSTPRIQVVPRPRPRVTSCSSSSVSSRGGALR